MIYEAFCAILFLSNLLFIFLLNKKSKECEDIRTGYSDCITKRDELAVKLSRLQLEKEQRGNSVELSEFLHEMTDGKAVVEMKVIPKDMLYYKTRRG